MSTTLVTDAIAAIGERDLDRTLRAIAPGLVMHVAGMPHATGRDRWLATLEALLAGFPDLRIDVEHASGAGDRVAVRTVLRGTHAGRSTASRRRAARSRSRATSSTGSTMA